MITVLLAANQRLKETMPLIIPGGILSATQGGIVTRLRPPLSRLSGYFPWRMVPSGFAALRLLASGEGDVRTTRLIEMMFMLTEDHCRTNPTVRAAFEESDAWCQDVEQIIRWGVGLADRCPDRSVAKDLARMPTLTPPELDTYVRPWLS